MSEPFAPLEGFDGTARLFPLPNLVFFPHVMQPLHIFEPRYRQMTADALAGDRLIALVLPKPDWEADYAGKTAIHAVGAIGTIVSDQKIDDGRYNILLKGLSRIRIHEEIAHDTLYRTARVERLLEAPLAGAALEKKWRRKLAELVPTWFAGQHAVLEQFRNLLSSDLPLGPLCDILAFALPLDIEVKQTLLEEVDVEKRLTRLLRNTTGESTPTQQKFPPDFSEN